MYIYIYTYLFIHIHIFSQDAVVRLAPAGHEASVAAVLNLAKGRADETASGPRNPVRCATHVFVHVAMHRACAMRLHHACRYLLMIIRQNYMSLIAVCS